MNDNYGSIKYTPEKGCKYCGKNDCNLRSKHRNLNRCKVCLYGWYRQRKGGSK